MTTPLFVTALMLGITDRETITNLIVDEEATRNMTIEQRDAYFRRLDEQSGIDSRPHLDHCRTTSDDTKHGKDR